MKNSDSNFFSIHFKLSKLEIETMERTLTEESSKKKKLGIRKDRWLINWLGYEVAQLHNRVDELF